MIADRLAAPMPPPSARIGGWEERPIQETAQKLQIIEGEHYLIEDPQRLPYDPDGVLGGGASAVVERVKDRNTGKAFAKKVIRFRAIQERKAKEERFNSEVKSMGILKGHRHIISLFITYTAKREFGMIMEPVAKNDLSAFLADYSEIADKAASPDTVFLEQAFGCLASALAYIHEKGIRHKDIKPQNILVGLRGVIFSDFGTSKAFAVQNESTTEGTPQEFTKRYAAPEVLEHNDRNYTSDMFSLGGVFAEVFSVLWPDVRWDRSKIYSEAIEDLHENLSSASVPPRLSCLPNAIISMTLRDRHERVKAAPLASVICANAALCCKICGNRSPWKLHRATGRYYSYVKDGDVVMETLWTDDPPP